MTLETPPELAASRPSLRNFDTGCRLSTMKFVASRAVARARVGIDASYRDAAIARQSMATRLAMSPAFTNPGVTTNFLSLNQLAFDSYSIIKLTSVAPSPI